MITKSSRYSDGEVLDYAGQMAVVRRFPDTSSVKYKYVRWTDADRLDLLAARYFGDAKAWWRFMDLNPALLSRDDIRPGTMLRVPDA